MLRDSVAAGVNLRTGCGVCCENHGVVYHCPCWSLDLHCLLLGSGTLSFFLPDCQRTYCIPLPWQLYYVLIQIGFVLHVALVCSQLVLLFHPTFVVLMILRVTACWNDSTSKYGAYNKSACV